MLLLSTIIREMMTVIDRVLGSARDASMDFRVTWGCMPNKRLKNRVLSINALPSDSFFQMQSKTRRKIMIILKVAGIFSKRVMV